jgi:hypothetical protein
MQAVLESILQVGMEVAHLGIAEVSIYIHESILRVAELPL